MLKRVIQLSVASLFCLPMISCSAGDDGDNFASFTSFPTTTAATVSTTATTAEDESSSSGGDGDGDVTGDGDADPTDPPGDGDGDDPTTTDDPDTSCPPGEFGCPCDAGQCVAGLSCVDGECQLGGGDGDGDPDPTTTGGNDPWDPANCIAPSMLVSITGIEGDVCSGPCVGDVDCPAGPVGTTPACALILEGAVDPNQCALICDPLNDTCSVGATCKDVPDQPGLGLCTYP